MKRREEHFYHTRLILCNKSCLYELYTKVKLKQNTFFLSAFIYQSTILTELFSLDFCCSHLTILHTYSHLQYACHTRILYSASVGKFIREYSHIPNRTRKLYGFKYRVRTSTYQLKLLHQNSSRFCIQIPSCSREGTFLPNNKEWSLGLIFHNSRSWVQTKFEISYILLVPRGLQFSQMIVL